MRWPIVSVGDVAEVQLGKMLSQKSHTGNGTSNYLRNINVQWGKIDFSNLLSMDFDREEREKFSLKNGDLLVCEGGEPGRCAIVERDLDGIFFQKALMRVRAKNENLEMRFMQRFMQYSASKGVFTQDGNQATIAHFPAVRMNAFKIPLPPIEEQRRIAAILDKADAIRRKRKEAIALTEELLRSTFLEMFGDPVTNPKGWPVKPLGDLVSILGGGTPSRSDSKFFSGTICWASPKDFKSDEMNETEEHITKEAIDASATKLAPKDTILIVVKSKVLMHRLPIAVSSVPICFSQDVKGLIPHTLPSRYLSSHIKACQQVFLDMARGINTEGLTLEHIRNHSVMIPDENLLAKYVKNESKVRGAITKQKVSLQEAENLFNSLVHRAFRGELTQAEHDAVEGQAHNIATNGSLSNPEKNTASTEALSPATKSADSRMDSAVSPQKARSGMTERMDTLVKPSHEGTLHATQGTERLEGSAEARVAPVGTSYPSGEVASARVAETRADYQAPNAAPEQHQAKQEAMREALRQLAEKVQAKSKESGLGEDRATNGSEARNPPSGTTGPSKEGGPQPVFDRPRRSNSREVYASPSGTTGSSKGGGHPSIYERTEGSEAYASPTRTTRSSGTLAEKVQQAKESRPALALTPPEAPKKRGKPTK